MKLVVDTNIIISALIKDAVSRDILHHFSGELLTISLSHEEISRHNATILKKSGLTGMEVGALLEKIMSRLVVVPDDLVRSRLNDAAKIMDNIDPSDTPFIAAALATQSGIWSNDAHFDRQRAVRVWKTSELVKLL